MLSCLDPQEKADLLTTKPTSQDALLAKVWCKSINTHHRSKFKNWFKFNLLSEREWNVRIQSNITREYNPSKFAYQLPNA